MADVPMLPCHYLTESDLFVLFWGLAFDLLYLRMYFHLTGYAPEYCYRQIIRYERSTHRRRGDDD